MLFVKRSFKKCMDGQRWTLRLKLFNQICWQVCIYCWQLLIFAVNKNQVVSQAMYFLLPKKKVIKEGTHWFASTSTFFWMELVHIGFTSLCLDYVLVLVSPKIDLISVGKASSSIVPPISLLDVYFPLKISKWMTIEGKYLYAWTKRSLWKMICAKF